MENWKKIENIGKNWNIEGFFASFTKNNWKIKGFPIIFE